MGARVPEYAPVLQVQSVTFAAADAMTHFGVVISIKSIIEDISMRVPNIIFNSWIHGCPITRPCKHTMPGSDRCGSNVSDTASSCLC